MGSLENVEKIILTWKALGEKNSEFTKEGSIQVDESYVLLSIISNNSPVGIFIKCEINEDAVNKAINLLESRKELL